MAKTNESKNEVKKLQKEIVALKNKLKAAEKKNKTVQKNWDKGHLALQKDMKKRVEAGYKEGFSSGFSEAGKKEEARKKALNSAEVAFEKDYRKSQAKPKATKGKRGAAKTRTKAVKPRATTKIKAKKVGRKPRVEKAAIKKAKTTSDRSSLKRRGRPPKQQQVKKSHISENQHIMNLHEETSLPQNHEMVLS